MKFQSVLIFLDADSLGVRSRTWRTVRPRLIYNSTTVGGDCELLLFHLIYAQFCRRNSLMQEFLWIPCCFMKTCSNVIIGMILFSPAETAGAFELGVPIWQTRWTIPIGHKTCDFTISIIPIYLPSSFESHIFLRDFFSFSSYSVIFYLIPYKFGEGTRSFSNALSTCFSAPLTASTLKFFGFPVPLDCTMSQLSPDFFIPWIILIH